MPSLASGVFYVAITAATALGLYLRRHRPDALSALLIATAISISLIHSLVEVRDRYHSYAMPLLMPIAAFAIVAVLRRARWIGDDADELTTDALASKEPEAGASLA